MVRSSGPFPFRVLLFGGGPAVGYGVLSHDLGLAGHLARCLTQATGYGIDMDVVAQVDLRCRKMPALVSDVDLERYDMVIMSVGVQDVLDFASVSEWSDSVEHVLDLLREGSERAYPVCVIAVPTISSVFDLEAVLARAADHRAAEFNNRLNELCTIRPGYTFVPIVQEGEAVPCRERRSDFYRRWAEPMADIIASTLDSVRDRAHPNRPEVDRHAALQRLDLLDTAPDENFDSITRSARRIFRCVGAGIALIDDDRQWFSNTSGLPIPELPRSGAIGDYVIQTNHGFFVEDALGDPRLADSYLVTTAKLRSYAGIPIRDPSGHMIGVLCVYDDKPHQFTTVEIAILRSLAHLIENQLLAVA
jgi:hypothetical protein